VAIAELVVAGLQSLQLAFPKLPPAQLAALADARKRLGTG